MVHLAIFAKYWEAGAVKTRLAKVIGPQLACDVYVVFLQYLVDKFSEFGDERTIVFTPNDRRKHFQQAFSECWNLEPQVEGDLGVRMKHFFELFNVGTKRKNILIGSDTPDLPEDIMRQAEAELNDVPIVIGPSGDGGYYLIGIKGDVPDVFSGMPWSTEELLELTLERLIDLGVPYRLLPELKDVDEFEDLQRLVTNLRTSGDHPILLARLEALELQID